MCTYPLTVFSRLDSVFLFDIQQVVCKCDTSSSPPLVTLLQRLDSDPTFYPSLEERVMIDVASATATVIEMCCMRELRVATRTNASLLERVTVIRSTLHHGQLRLPRYY